MSNLSVPFNLTLLDLNDNVLQGLRPVKSLDVFQPSSHNFHEDGLFSPTIFGRVGEERRNRMYSYIDIKVPVFHPLIFNTFGQLKRLYPEIIAGKSYAVWDEEIKDFVKSNQLEGSTGFHFFAQHWDKIVFEGRGSDLRENNIKLIEKFKKQSLTSKVIVMPAGLRDYEIQDNGKESENEFNALYRKLLIISNSFTSGVVKNSLEMLNNPRFSLQLTFNAIYDKIIMSLEGKKKIVMGKWASRAIANGTRNVITSVNIPSDNLNSEANFKFNDTLVGLYQYIKAILPVAKYQIKHYYLTQVFTGPNTPAVLVNKQTLKRESVRIPASIYDSWMTDEGLDRVMTLYGEEALRHQVIEIQGYYIGLIYKGNGTFRIFQDIDELPEHLSKNDVYPLTFTELIYLSVYEHVKKYHALVTRYPVTGFGSIYPSFIHLKPTVRTEVRYPLNDVWEIDKESLPAYQFPTKTAFINSMGPHSTKLARMGADFDGDMGSLNVVYSEEGSEEINNYLNSVSFYVGTDGKISHSVGTDTVRYLMKTMTGEPVQRV